MIRANLYSSEPLEPSFKQSVSDGLDLVGQNIGGISLAKTHIVKLPVSSHNKVDVTRVGFKKFDTLTELHIMAVPLDGVYEANAGLAYFNFGIVWLNTAILKAKSEIRSITAHEAAHSIGYVLPDSPQTFNVSESHCSCDDCIMYRSYSMDRDSESLIEASQLKIDVGFRKTFKTMGIALPSEEFCTPCRADMIDTAEENIEQLRMNRFKTGVVF